MNKISRRDFLKIAGIAAAAGTLSACGAASSTAASTAASSAAAGSTAASAAHEPVTITVWTGQDTTGGGKALREAFMAKYPWVTVEAQEFSGNSDDRKKALITSLSAADDDPDVFDMDIIWVGQFAASGWLMDVTDSIEKDSYLGGPLSTCYYNDKAYAFPNYTDVGLLYYRSDIIGEAEVPKTWDELTALCQKYQAANNIANGFVFQSFQSEAVVCNALEFIKQNGGKDVENGEVLINSQNTIDALDHMKKLIADGISPEGVLTHKPDDTRAIFEQGNALFMRNWTYAYANAQGADSLVKGKVGVTTLPKGPNGTESCGTVGGWNFGVSAYTDQPEAAVLYAQFASSAEGQKIISTYNSTFPTVAALYEDADLLKANPLLGYMKTALDEAKARPGVKDYPTLSSAMQVDLHKILTGEVETAAGVATLETDMKNAIAAMG